MGSQESLEVLKRVQEIDREIYQIRRELAAVPAEIQRFAMAFEAEKTKVAALEAELKQIQLRQKQKEADLSEKETLIRKYDSQLTQVKTNKEYSALQQEITSLKADTSIIEDGILTLFEDIDCIQKEVRQERERLAQLQKDLEQKKIEFEKRAESLKTDLNSLSEKRLAAIAQVPPETRELYDRIIERKEGWALVHVEGETCAACRIEIRPQLLNELKIKENLVVCENCSRILYLD